MKISLHWLKQLVASDLDGAALADRLTRAGLEVESTSRFGDFSGVIVAEVRGKKPHPNAAKLTLVDVWDGATVTQVVCGASNVPEPGHKVLWARPGATLPGGITLAPKEVRGIVSPGMLCAEDELGLGASHNGILLLSPDDPLTPGTDVAVALGLPDTIWEVNVTPNRPDCLGHLGVAREVSALTGAALRSTELPMLPESGAAAIKVTVADREACRRYAALRLTDLIVRQSPLWLRLRLLSLGARAVSNVVDATNLVLFECGQPLHAFDSARLSGGELRVRRAQVGEVLRTLDGQDRELSSDDLVIADAERAVALAGVMGGENSEVSATTTEIVLESAYFAPQLVRRTAKRLGLHSEASHRFERGVDPDGIVHAARRCAGLLMQLSGARVEGALVDAYPSEIPPRHVSLRPERCERLLGFAISATKQAEILQDLGLAVEYTPQLLKVTVPPRRPDLSREIDLIEEVARVAGYDRVPSTVPRLLQAPRRLGDALPERVRDALTGLGFDEIISYAFVSPSSVAMIEGEQFVPLRIQNPLREEQSAMRTSLLPGLIAAMARNLPRGETDLRLFEVGERFLPGDTAPQQRRLLAGLLAGRQAGWLQPGGHYDFFDIKGAVDGLLRGLGQPEADYRPGAVSWLHPGVQAELWLGDTLLGHLGELHPELQQRHDLGDRALLFEIDLDALPSVTWPKLTALPRFPSVSRDLSFFIDERIAAAAIRQTMQARLPALCVAVQVREDYREAGRVPAGKKSMLWSFTYRALDRTLTDAEVQAAHGQFVEELKQHLSIDLR